MARQPYKKYMKKNTAKDYNLLKIFVISFFGMLLVFTFLIKSFSPSVDVSIGGDYNQEESENLDEIKKIVDGRLAMIQEEDLGRNFSELVKSAEEEKNKEIEENKKVLSKSEVKDSSDNISKDGASDTAIEPVFKVFIGTYTSAEQAKVAKDIIVESGSNLNPIVKCIGSNNYTLQVGIFKNKTSAESLLYTIQQNHLPGRIVQDY